MGNLIKNNRLNGTLSGGKNLKGNVSGVGNLKGGMSTPTGGNYERLINKPSINGIELKGNKSSTAFGIPSIYYGTTEEWNSHIEIVSEFSAIYIYTDYKVESDISFPAIKIGDGTTYLIDLPFVTADTTGVEHMLESHIADSLIHVSPEDRAFWNSKHKAIVGEDETLTFTDL